MNTPLMHSSASASPFPLDASERRTCACWDSSRCPRKPLLMLALREGAGDDERHLRESLLADVVMEPKGIPASISRPDFRRSSTESVTADRLMLFPIRARISSSVSAARLRRLMLLGNSLNVGSMILQRAAR